MSSPKSARRPLILRVAAVAAGAVVLLTTALAGSASAHGNVVDPPSRNYGCHDRWGTNHQAPEMATQDPMCHQAWQADPSAMWNWNGLFREGVAGNHEAAIPNGQLCSAGRSNSGRYNALDAVGDWKAKAIGNNFSIRLFDQASHGADYIRVYVTKQGFDPITEPLGWDDLELTGQIGNTPASRWDPATGGVAISVPASAPGRTGRHMVYTIWQASHLDQSYYLCSDVTFSGGSTNPPTTPPTPPTIPPTTPTIPPTTPAPGSCSATYSVTAQWSGGFQGQVLVTAGTAAIKGWTVDWTYSGAERITQTWNAAVTTDGSTVTARNATYNGNLAAGGSATFGFLGSGTAGTSPVLSCTAA